MAWAEFSDWLRRTVERNVDGAQFEFDIRQWNSSIRKWWFRAVEMDVQAKAVSETRAKRRLASCGYCYICLLILICLDNLRNLLRDAQENAERII